MNAPVIPSSILNNQHYQRHTLSLDHLSSNDHSQFQSQGEIIDMVSISMDVVGEYYV